MSFILVNSAHYQRRLVVIELTMGINQIKETSRKSLNIKRNIDQIHVHVKPMQPKNWASRNRNPNPSEVTRKIRKGWFPPTWVRAILHSLLAGSET